MDIRTLQNFLQLAATLNYRRTAEGILIAQPALSRQIIQLEEELGATLFNRTKRSVELTEAGAFFRVEIERILQQFDEICRQTGEIHRGEAGEIRIGYASSSMTEVLPKILVALRNKHPNLRVLLSEGTNLFQIEALKQRTLDVAFAPNIILPTDIESRIVYQENFILILPENHPLSIDTFSSIAQVAHEQFILPPRPESCGYVETIEAMCQAVGFLPKVAQQSGHSATVMRLIEAGFGISIEPKSALTQGSYKVKTIELTDIPQKAVMKMMWLRERTAGIQRFLEVVEPFLLESLV
ncbi:MAG: LysR substrate-binding domain-containing protein [Saprospiraceae bacterium]|nr:LysR substrate-binding domain-containing protein [Saprospiraceae bacterium]